MELYILPILFAFGCTISLDSLPPKTEFLPIDNFVQPNVLDKEEVRHITYNRRCACKCNFMPAKDSTCHWKKVFKAVSGDGSNVLDDFRNAGNIPKYESETAHMISSNQTYRDASVLDNWNNLYIKEVKIELFKNSVRTAWFLFSGRGSGLTSWMSHSRLLASSYSRMLSDRAYYQELSVTGDISLGRSFYIVEDYANCTEDCTHFVIEESVPSKTCRYDINASYPMFLHSHYKNECGDIANEEYKMADRFVVSVNVCDVEL